MSALTASIMVGWLSIAGTTLNYPVMQTPNEPNYYLKRNFEKEYSDLGTPYIQENCDLTSSDNLVIYGHHIKGGKMFGALEDYKSQSFYEEHKTIQFDTLTQRGEYEITVFVSSHLLSEVELMADTVGILNHGRLLFEGTLEQLRSGAAAQGYPTDNLEDTFLALIDADNRQRGAVK